MEETKSWMKWPLFDPARQGLEEKSSANTPKLPAFEMIQRKMLGLNKTKSSVVSRDKGESVLIILSVFPTPLHCNLKLEVGRSEAFQLFLTEPQDRFPTPRTLHRKCCTS